MKRLDRSDQIAIFKLAVWALIASPLLWLAYLISIELQTPTLALGADPGEAVVHYLGIWSLRILLVAFSVTPLYRLTRITLIARSRRLVGLWAFTYVVIHFLSYFYFFLQFDWAEFFADFVERAYITAGIVAWLLLLSMAVTSTRKWRLRLGKRWQQLHYAIYPAICAALIHFWWFTRDQYGEVLAYVGWFLVLLGLRGFFHYRTRHKSRRARTA